MLTNSGYLTSRPEKILFVFSPGSGRKSKRVSQKVLTDFCIQHHIACRVAILGEDDIAGIFHAFRPDMVVAAGGDGTVNAAGKLVLNTDIPLGVIPLGSSNGFAKNLFLPLNHQAALDNLLTGHVKEIDTLEINGHHCFHICDIGINAALVARSHHSKIRGVLVYFINLLKELFTFHFFKYSVQTVSEKIESKAFAIIITNEKKFGTNAVINPGGKVDDGLFEICIIKPFPIYRLFELLFKVFRKNINTSGFSIFMRADKAIIHNIDREHLHIDGEPVHFKHAIEIAIQPRSLRVLVPKGVQ